MRGAAARASVRLSGVLPAVGPSQSTLCTNALMFKKNTHTHISSLLKNKKRYPDHNVKLFKS